MLRSRSGLLAALVTALSVHGANAQTPASYTPFGTGCSSGLNHPALYATKLPYVGREFVTVVARTKPSTWGALIIGGSDRSWGGARLPLNLRPIGAPNCNLLVSWDLTAPFHTGTGITRISVIIPNQVSLIGTTWFQQALTTDPKSNQLGWAMSNGAKATVGSCPCGPPRPVVEDFQTDKMLDRIVSGGRWFAGRAVPPQVGGRGLLGAFAIEAGRQDRVDPKKYWFDTDRMVIPGKYTPTGKDVTVVGGLFEFATMHVASGYTLAFTGSNRAQIRVAGTAVIDGRIEANAPTVPFFLAGGAAGPKSTGGPGGNGNCGGGKGGQGGDSCQNTGGATKYTGRSGETLRLPSGNGYQTHVANTPGKGSPFFPPAGKHNSYCALTGVFCGLMNIGGGGGGFTEPGLRGQPIYAAGKIQNPCRDPKTSPPAPYPNTGGKSFDLGGVTNNHTGHNRSLDFYSVGGSGGGGGGSHPLLTRRAPFDKWLPGAGGAGGGGIVALRIGQDLKMGIYGQIQAKGGRGYTFDGVLRAGETGDNLFNVPAPGGGGSGGTILLQVAGQAALYGLLDTSGGKGGLLDNTPTAQSGLLARAFGGDGGAGYVRLETHAAPTVQQVGKSIPAATAKNIGKLTDFEMVGIMQSKFYTTLVTAPPYLKYVVEANVHGKRRVYSDDPNHKDKDFAGAASGPGPLHFAVQGGRMDPKTGKVLSTSPWRNYVFHKTLPSLNGDNANVYRFRIRTDQTQGAIAVMRVEVWIQP